MPDPDISMVIKAEEICLATIRAAFLIRAEQAASGNDGI